MKITDLVTPTPTRQDLVDFCNQLNTSSEEAVPGEQSVLKFLQSRYGKKIKQFSLDGIDASGLNFYKSNFYGCDISHANFSNCNLGWTSGFSKAEGVNLSYSNLMNANFTRSRLINANLQGTNALYANFYKANLTGANVTHSTWMKTRLNNATLTNTDFTDSNLTNSHLVKALIGGTKFTRCVIFKMTGVKANDPVLHDTATSVSDLTTTIEKRINTFDKNILSKLWDSYHFFENSCIRADISHIDYTSALQNIEKSMGSKNNALFRENIHEYRGQINTTLLALKRLKIRLPRPVLFEGIIGRLAPTTTMRYDGQSVELHRPSYKEMPQELAIANDANKRKQDDEELTHVERENKRQKNREENKKTNHK